MQLPRMAMLLILVLGSASGCSVRGQDLCKDSFHGPIRYAVVRGPLPEMSLGKDYPSFEEPDDFIDAGLPADQR